MIPVEERSPQIVRRERPSIRSLPVLLASGLALAFLLIPLLALILRAVERQAWQDAPGVFSAVLISLVTTLCTAGLTILFGTPLAYALARWRFPLRRPLAALVELPIVLPPAVAGLGLLVAFGRRGLFGPALESLDVTLPFTTAAVILAQTFVSAPFFIRAAQIGFRTVPPELEDAARVDGAGEWAIFWHILLPLSMHALASGLILSWARALGEFGATILFAGSLQGRTQTMPLLIYAVLERDLDAAIWTGVILIVLAGAALLGASWLSRRSSTWLP